MEGNKIRNMEEFASVSGISRPTLSKYFNDPTSVRDSTRKRIEAAVEQYDYRPNLYAMNQNRRLTKNIGIVVPYLADPFFAEIARTLENHVLRTGYRPVLLGSHGRPELEIENLENLRLIKPAGVLLAPLGRVSEREHIEAFCKEVPTVLFDANIDGVGHAFVGSNNGQSIGLIVDYLCRTGEPPAFFEMETPTNPNAYKRRTAYLAAMERLDHKPRLIQAPGEGWEFEEIGFREGSRLLRDKTLPTDTILCSNDRLAIGFLSAAYEAGLRVGLGPGCALRVAGHDDHPFSRYTCPTLTTVSQDYEAIAKKSAEALLELIEAGSPGDSREETLFEGRLIMRGSA
ncbi:LacI family DNA-binding transcriptional regulator [Phaeobacter italicus]|uniref:LacI family DNA-binding transcriptional regulator n=1 Tax=Phaeobacter italicus TaxID=481446 RepID=UPI000619E08D|nr:LacI family DNA-binding transcriptional regulator [Phaeobacter italicus]MBY6042406.1 LacI family transcriptional regulator [Phaeobacter italicus]NKX40531.1 LacI family transcriptional regulator [Rhodobacteraceae bacterium R_SAG2]